MGPTSTLRGGIEGQGWEREEGRGEGIGGCCLQLLGGIIGPESNHQSPDFFL